MRSVSLTRVIGSLGVLTGVINAVLYWKVISSPGDDNAIALLFVLGVVLSALPSMGLVLGPGRLGLARMIWLAASGLVLLVFLLFVGLMFLPALW